MRLQAKSNKEEHCRGSILPARVHPQWAAQGRPVPRSKAAPGCQHPPEHQRLSPDDSHMHLGFRVNQKPYLDLHTDMCTQGRALGV